MPLCGAKTRAGTPCKRAGMPNGRCSKHGGKSTGAPLGTRNALKHGIYSAALLPDEADIWDDVAIGRLDDDIRIAKLQLRRALIAQNKQHADGLELYEESINTGSPAESTGNDGEPKVSMPSSSTKRRRTQYDEVISRLLGRIGDLEQKRAEMLERSGGNKANADETARKVRETLAAMRAATSA